MPGSHHHVHSLLAYARALMDPGTYDPRANLGLWLGLALAVPIPVLAIALSAPLYVVLASLFAPLGWSVIVGAASQVGTLRAEVIDKLRSEARKDATVREETYAKLRSEALSERGHRTDLAKILTLARADLALAEIVHQGLLAQDIESDDLVVRIRHIPHAYIGGDYVQAIRPRPDLLYLCIGDVAGHGVAAALVVSRIHGLVLRLIQENAGPKEFLVEMERAVRDVLVHTSLFMTFVILRIDMAARRIEYGTAGHPAQFLLHAGTDIEELFTPNMLLGVPLPFARRDQKTGVATYEPGDTLLLFTDGLFEVAGSTGHGEMWGEAALKSLFAGVGQDDPAVAADRILDASQAHRGAHPADDDVSLVVVRLGRRPGDTAARGP